MNRRHFTRHTNSWFPAGIWWPVSPENSADRQVYRPRMVDQGPNKGNKIQFVVLPDGVHIEFTTRVNE